VRREWHHPSIRSSHRSVRIFPSPGVGQALTSLS
jgi:hypothetical protein